MAQLLELALQDTFVLATLASIILEVEHALTKPYFAKRVNTKTIELVRAFLNKQSIGPVLHVGVHGVASQPEDDLILATALSASADFLVTGDKMLLKLESYSGVTIVSPGGFLAILDGLQ